MVLNYLWVGFILVAFVVALAKALFLGDTAVFPALLQSTFDNAKTGFELSLALTGVMSLWLGLMKIGEKGGMVQIFSKAVGPFFARLFPEVPRNHPAIGAMIMNFSANMLGLDNAATPLGLKAMKELQTLNPTPDTASNAQIMFIVLNTSGLTIIPIAIIADRATLGALNPTSIFIPTLLATFCSTLIALLIVSIRQRINLLNPVVLLYLVTITGTIGLSILYFMNLNQEELIRQSSLITSVVIISVLVGFILLGLVSRINLFETFIEGAKEGFETAIRIIPYLVAILMAIGLFRVSGAMEYVMAGIKAVIGLTGVNADFTDALPVAILKPMTGTGAKVAMIDICKTFGPDSFQGNLASIFRGSTETTFYILALYYGSVNIKKMKYTLSAALLADLGGIIAGIFIGYWFFH